MNTVKHYVNETKGARLQFTGLGYKILTEGKVTQERQSLINELTDTVINAADGILVEVEKMDKQLEEKGKKIEGLKKDLGGCKRRLGEASLGRDSLEREWKKIKEDRDKLEEECRELRREKEEMRGQLDSIQKSLMALSFMQDDGEASCPGSPTAKSTPKPKADDVECSDSKEEACN